MSTSLIRLIMVFTSLCFACEKLILKTSTPSIIIFSMIEEDEEEGPIVAIILVFLIFFINQNLIFPQYHKFYKQKIFLLLVSKF